MCCVFCVLCCVVLCDCYCVVDCYLVVCGVVFVCVMLYDLYVFFNCECVLFIVVVDVYEMKKYVEGVVVVDVILKKFFEYGEMLVMKGLIVCLMDEGYECYDEVYVLCV